MNKKQHLWFINVVQYQKTSTTMQFKKTCISIIFVIMDTKNTAKLSLIF